MIWIGTSGWVYKHWIGCFYPPEMKQREWLQFYARHFSTVEINRSFYRLPSYENFRHWAWQAGFHERFVFVTKAQRHLTHFKRLYSPEFALDKLLGAAHGLGPHFGPLLFQLPPGMGFDPARLRYFVERLPEGVRAAFEFRERSWYNAETYAILGSRGCALVRAVGGHYTPFDAPDTGTFRYLRVHGGQYGVGLTEGELRFWAGKVAWWAGEGLDVYAYFNNDPDCHAIRNAFALRDMVAHTGAVMW